MPAEDSNEGVLHFGSLAYAVRKGFIPSLS